MRKILVKYFFSQSNRLNVSGTETASMLSGASSFYGKYGNDANPETKEDEEQCPLLDQIIRDMEDKNRRIYGEEEAMEATEESVLTQV